MASKPILYNAWFCPFAQRAWIALIQKGVQFDYVEQDPYQKTPEWLAVNPRGLVPAIVHNGKSVYESGVCIEYIEDAWPSDDPAKSLLPKDPFQKAYSRIWSDYLSKNIIPTFYRLLMNQETGKQAEINGEFLGHVSTLQSAMDKSGPFFLGTQFSLVDIMLAPFAWRLTIITKHYRQFEVPNNEEFARYQKWWNAVKEVESFKATLQPEGKLVEKYHRYSTGKAQSKVGDAIRTGKTLP